MTQHSVWTRSLFTTLVVVASCAPPRDDVQVVTPIPVRTEVVAATVFAPTLYLLGTVRPSASVPLRAIDAGTIRYPARFASGLVTGEVVEEGELLATVFNPAHDRELREARLDQESKEAELSRARRSLAAGLVAEVELARFELAARLASERFRAAERATTRLALRALRAGALVIQTVVAPGSEVATGYLLGHIAATGPPRIESRAAASDRDKLRPGLAVRIAGPGDLANAGGAHAELDGARGIVREVAPMVDDTGTVRVVVEVTESTGLPAPGEGVELLVELGRRAEVVTVPESALVVGGDGTSVFILAGTGLRRSSVRRVGVTTGARGDGRIEIVSGLNTGERLVVAGVTQVSDGVEVVEVASDAAVQ